MPSQRQSPSSIPQKLCVACREPIPADAKVCFHCQQKQTPEKEFSLSNTLKWVGAISAIIGLITALSGVVGPVKGWWSQGRQSKALLANALRQEELGEYPAAFGTLSEILKNRPNNEPARRARLDVAMLWIEDVWMPRHSDEQFEKSAHDMFTAVTPALQAALGSSKDYRAADVLAHLGWLNLLKWKVDSQQGIIDEHLRNALKIDPDNVFAHAMMGDLILETQGSLEEAKAHFAAALKTGKMKPFVRSCQLQGMIYNDSPGVPAELIRLANQMRKDGDPLGDGNKGRIRYLFASWDDSEMRDVYTALPPDEEWPTFVWLNQAGEHPSDESDFPKYVKAKIDQFNGKTSEALQEFRDLQQELQKEKSTGSLVNAVVKSIKQLEHPAR